LAGDLAGSYSSPALASITTAGTTKLANITVDDKGRVTSSASGEGFAIAMAIALG
jgi:hypothetical protein